MTHKQNLYKKQKQKRRREIHTCNSVDSRFDKAFCYGFHKYQIALSNTNLSNKKKQNKTKRELGYVW